MTSKYTLNVQGNMRKICPAPWGKKDKVTIRHSLFITYAKVGFSQCHTTFSFQQTLLSCCYNHGISWQVQY